MGIRIQNGVRIYSTEERLRTVVNTCIERIRLATIFLVDEPQVAVLTAPVYGANVRTRKIRRRVANQLLHVEEADDFEDEAPLYPGAWFRKSGDGGNGAPAYV